MPVDKYLATYLVLFRNLVSDSEQAALYIEKAEQRFSSGVQLSPKEMEAVRESINQFVASMTNAADCADRGCPLLQSLFLDRFASFNRIKRKFRIPQAEKEFFQKATKVK